MQTTALLLAPWGSPAPRFCPTRIAHAIAKPIGIWNQRASIWVTIDIAPCSMGPINPARIITLHWSPESHRTDLPARKTPISKHQNSRQSISIPGIQILVNFPHPKRLSQVHPEGQTWSSMTWLINSILTIPWTDVAFCILDVNHSEDEECETSDRLGNCGAPWIKRIMKDGGIMLRGCTDTRPMFPG